MAKAKYEGMFLLPAGQADPEAAVNGVRAIVERHNGKVLLIKKWDERKLAYEIKKQKRGLYVICYFTSPGDAIGAITRDVNLSDDILRVMITDASHLTEEEMAAVEPQQPPPPPPERFDRFGGGFDRGGDRYGDRGDRGGDRGGDRPSRRREESGEPSNA